MTARWVFGYGSLIWRPDMPFAEASPARLPGFSRRFWQGSHDHRGVPESPGRVVTLIPENSSVCEGVAYLIEAEVVETTFERLDHREKNGYERHHHTLHLTDGREVPGLVYLAPAGNFAFLGEAPLPDIARQIIASAGPSGRNIDYLLELAAALRHHGFEDSHVFDLEAEALAQLD